MDEGFEVDGEPIVSRGNASEVFELVEAALDAISCLVGFEVVGDQALSGWIAGNDGGGADVGDEGSESVAIVGLVGEDLDWPEAVKKGWRLRHIAGLSGCENDPQGPPLRIGCEMDLGGQSPSGTPQSLILVPPFPVAACWWARTRVLSSMRYSLSGSEVRAAKMLSQTPALAQRVKRLCVVFHLP